MVKCLICSLYTENEFESWPEHPIPEIRRSNLTTVLIQIIAMGMEKPLTFPFFDRPEEASFIAALEELEWLGALTQKVVSGDVVVDLTKDGQLMAKFPLDPRFSRFVYF
jgi:HrpA-like RNA helicase